MTIRTYTKKPAQFGALALSSGTSATLAQPASVPGVTGVTVGEATFGKIGFLWGVLLGGFAGWTATSYAQHKKA
jgi:hypothetical protein